MAKVSIIGAYNTQFGNFVKKNKETGEVTDLKSIYDLMLEAGRGAISDAGIDPKDIDGVWVGSCAPGIFANQEHLAAFAPEIAPDALRFKPTYRCEDACSSGSVAVYSALYALESGRAKVALVLGVEKMNLLDTKGVTHALATCSYWPEEGAKGYTFPGLFAEYAKGYAAQYGFDRPMLAEMLATVSALNYRNGIDNPLAHFGKGGVADRLGLMTAEAILALPDEKNPMIAEPLRLHDCSLVTDGAAAIVLVRDDLSLAKSEKAVKVAGLAHVNERLPISVRPNMYELMAGKRAVQQAFAEAGITIADVDLAEVHDCFTINQLLSTEALGLSADGRAGYDYMEGRFTRDDGHCAINLSGGLKAKGHPVGATGVSMHALVYKQLVGQPIGAVPAKKQPTVGVTFNVGGSSVTNCVTVLRKE
ncbi:3-ketoacyl-CoA thiolase [uncultured spirochete]|uniref:3-ketoacyl-CoA thiolase n=1 Tax=uncultured spirochete TaxID=156406 RepID=A0A3P3XNM2_9SPIR|nr:3-ketoacyl-CoA thiolase [uncultured spirochete]